MNLSFNRLKKLVNLQLRLIQRNCLAPNHKKSKILIRSYSYSFSKDFLRSKLLWIPVCVSIFFLLLPSFALALSIPPSEKKTIWSLAYKKDYSAYIDKETMFKTPNGFIAWFLIDYNSIQTYKIENKKVQFRSESIEIQIDCSLQISRIFSNWYHSGNMLEGNYVDLKTPINSSWDYHQVSPKSTITYDLMVYLCKPEPY